MLHCYCKSLQSRRHGFNQIVVWVHAKQIGCVEKVRKKKSCLMQNKCNNHGSRVQVEYTWLNASLCLKGCFVHYKICKLYTFRAKSLKKCVSCIVCFAFFLLKMTIWWWQEKWSKLYGCGNSPRSSAVAVNALYWKIQAVTKLLLGVHFHSEHLLLKKKCKNEKKKSCTLLSSLLSLLPSTDTQSILYLLSPLKTLE